MTEILTLEYRTRLANAKEEAGEMKSDIYLCNRNRIEGRRRDTRNIKRMDVNQKGELQH